MADNRGMSTSRNTHRKSVSDAGRRTIARHTGENGTPYDPFTELVCDYLFYRHSNGTLAWSDWLDSEIECDQELRQLAADMLDQLCVQDKQAHYADAWSHAAALVAQLLREVDL